uniref:Secreted protein n=1 Tax=Steinernema glaseri TaxID=37863 RepID=A0A1I8AJH0_9BILA
MKLRLMALAGAVAKPKPDPVPRVTAVNNSRKTSVAARTESDGFIAFTTKISKGLLDSLFNKYERQQKTCVIG